MAPRVPLNCLLHQVLDTCIGRANLLSSELATLQEAPPPEASPTGTFCARSGAPADYIFPCGHAFHKRFLSSWAACPLCGLEVVESVTKPFIEDDFDSF